ncbi:MAG: CbtA family protein [Chloroflexi bacterium]|nr:CbtA family protein [Chloroflexota bacterium]
MVGGLLVRGMLAGLLAGVLGFVYAHQFGEPSVNTAIAFESYVEYDVHQQPREVELVSRDLQSTAGLGTGTLIYGVAVGGMFALVFAATYGRLGSLAARGTAAVLGLLGFTAVYLVPFVKYPANPPSVGDPVTIQYRTAVYVVMLLASIASMVFAVALQRRLVARFGNWNATLLAAGAYVLAMGVCYAVFPAIDEVPQEALPNVIDAVTRADVTFPPTVLWSFRIASIGLQVVLWATISLVFGALAERLLENPRVAANRRVKSAV